jgi:hypothetical protein
LVTDKVAATAINAHNHDSLQDRSVSMRRPAVFTFASFDSIMQAPGGAEEDSTGGFTLGGWMFGYGDESMDISASGFDGRDREEVPGRRTCQI